MKRLILIFNLFVIFNQLNCESTQSANVDKVTDQTINKNDLPDDIKSSIITIAPLNDTRENLSIKWLGKGSSVMIVLAKNNKPKNEAAKTTSVYISYDYGSSFIKEDKLIIKDKNNTIVPIINTFITSKADNSHFMFTDIVNNYLFISLDYGRTYNAIKTCFSPENKRHPGHLCWAPKNIKMHPTITNLTIGSDDGENSDLYHSFDFGFTWVDIHSNVSKFDWAPFEKPERIYAMVSSKDGKTKGLYYTDDFFENSFFLRNDVKDFKICNKYIVIVRYVANVGTKFGGKSLKVDVSFNGSTFSYGLFNYDYKNSHDHKLVENVIDYSVVDCSDNELILAAKYNDSRYNLFVSNYRGNRFRLSLENLVPSNGNNKSTIDVHKVAGLSGIYIANTYEDKSNKTIVTKITYDGGYSWNKINLSQVQSDELSKCSDKNCSLHFVQNSLAYSFKYSGIISKESATGIIIASGVIDEFIPNDNKVNSKTVPQTFISRDAGKSWKAISDGKYLFNIGDNGGIIVGVKHFPKSTSTNSLIYSLDDGHTFSTLKFMNESMRVYSLLTENGEKSTVFTIFGSMDAGAHSWTLVKVNFTSLYNRTCKENDFDYWVPSSNSQCMMGIKMRLQRRKENATCLHGEEFNRKTRPVFCNCTREDYICDFGFHENEKRSCIPDDEYEQLGPDCKNEKLSRGFARIPGNLCIPEKDSVYEPIQLNCPEKPKREVFKTVFLSLILTSIVFLVGYFGLSYFKNRHTRGNFLNSHYNKKSDAAILLDADDLNESDQVRSGFSDDVPMVIS